MSDISAIPYRTPACDKHLADNDSDVCPWCRIAELESELDLTIANSAALNAKQITEIETLKAQIDELEEEKQHIEDGWTELVDKWFKPEIETLQAKIKRYETKLLTLGYLIEDE